MKKKSINLAIRTEGKGLSRIEVEGYAHTLPTGHEAVVHKDHRRLGVWVVSLDPIGVGIVFNAMTRKDAILRADAITKKAGKETIDHRIKSHIELFGEE